MVSFVLLSRKLCVERLIPLVKVRLHSIKVELINVLYVRAILVSEVISINWLHGLLVCLPEVYMC